MQIRTAGPADLPVIAQIEAECFPPAEAATWDSFRQRLEQYPDHFWLLEEGGKVVAFVNGMVSTEANLLDEMYDNAAMHNPQGSWQMIFGVDTLPSYRRRGCAQQLLRHVIAQAHAQGRKGLVLTCKEALVHYYAKFGFVSEGPSDSTHGGATWYQMRLTF